MRNFTTLLFTPWQSFAAVAPAYSPHQFNGIVCLSSYRHPAVQAAIRAAKYHRHQPAISALAALLEQHLAQSQSNNLTIVPIPQSFVRWRERGFNHLQDIVAHTQTRGTQLHVAPVLKKQTHTQRQAHVSRPVRLTQQRGSFACTAAAANLHGVVILLDDVTTTGSTMLAARATLAPHLPPDTTLICLALAH